MREPFAGSGCCLLSWWAALIVAAAQSADCDVLLTGDLQHGQAFDPTQPIKPPASLMRLVPRP